MSVLKRLRNTRIVKNTKIFIKVTISQVSDLKQQKEIFLNSK